jgi:signal transduction histidine kinase/CheY-like chemotaxis protein
MRAFVKSERSRTIRSALRWLVFACVIPAWLAILFFIIQSYERERSSIEQNTLGTARALVQAVDGELIGARAALQVLGASPYLSSGDLEKFYTEAQEALRSVPGDNIVLLSPSGNQLLNTAKPFGEPLPAQGGPDQVFRPFETGQPLISDLFMGPATARPLVSIVVPVFSDGRVAYALGIGIFSERLAEILRRQSLPPRWVASIFDSTGTIVARTHLADQFVGKHGSAPLIRRIAEVPEGVIESETLEGIPVLSSFSRSALSGWSVAIGIPTAEALGALRWSLWLSIAGAGALLMLGLWFAQIISRRIAGSIQVLAARTVALGEGEAITTPQLGIKEADEAAQSLVKASQILRQRAAERDQAEQAERQMLVEKRAAEEANRAKSEFLAGMSHEIRTPMTSVIGLTDLLLESNLTVQQRRHATLVRDAGQSVLAIVNDLLDLSKIEAGKLELDKVPFSPAAVAEAAIAIVRPGATAKGLELGSEIATDLPQCIEGDPTRLRQVLLNLLSNALKFTERGSVVLRVRRAPDKRQLRFEVADTGIGIDLAMQPMLFQRFSQLGRSYRQFGGTGLGLAISRNLVEAMGGAIGVDSRSGSGSTFWFTIPCVETQPPADATPRDFVVGADSSARVLVAEDNEMIRELIEAMLTDAGHEVVLVQNGVEALAALESGDFDVVLMDVQMPELDGIAATRQIRGMSDRVRGIPIISLTAYAMPEDVKRCLTAGANDHLSKPINRNELLRLVAKWSGTRHPLVAAPLSSSTPGAVIDTAFLNDLEARLGKARVAAFAGMFPDQVRKSLEAIKSTADRQRIAHESHNLVSFASSLGCVELTTCSRALLEAARQESVDVQPLVAAMRMAAGRALSAIQNRYPA